MIPHFTAALASVFVITTTAIAGERVPQRIESTTASATPLWISATAATDASGKLRPDVIDESSSAALHDFLNDQRQRREARRSGKMAGDAVADDCEGLSMFEVDSFASHHEPNRTVEQLMRYARVIVEGTAEEAVQGFLAGSPGTLYRVVVKKVLRGSSDVSTADGHLYLFYPYARIAIDNGTVCADVPKSVPPRVGGRILMFIYNPAFGPRRNIVAVDGTYELLAEGSTKALNVPSALRAFGSDFDAVRIGVVKHLQNARDGKHARD